MPLSRSKLSYPTWIGLTLAFYTFIAIGIANEGLGVLLPSILSSYNLTPATVALLFISQVTGYMIAALTSSLLSSRMGLGMMILVASITLTSSLVIYALTTDWTIMVVSGTLQGLGTGLIDSGINTYIANDQRNANLMGLLHAFYSIGALLGVSVENILLNIGLNWRLIYLQIAGLVGLVVIGMLWIVLHNYRPMTIRVMTPNINAWANLHLAFRTPIVIAIGLLLLVYLGIEASVSNWAYSIQNVSRDIPKLLAGYSVSAYWLGQTIGRLGTGYLVKRLGAVSTINFSLVLLISSLVTWWVLSDYLLSLPLIGVALGVIFPTTIWLIPQRVSPSLVAATIGFVNSLASLGAAIILIVVSCIANQVGLESIPILMLFLAALMVVLQNWLIQHTPT